jgi:hypothetical protein
MDDNVVMTDMSMSFFQDKNEDKALATMRVPGKD